jgi:cell division protease FtsH
VHMRKIKTVPDISLKDLAAGTPGMSGADLENLVNEAALLAARKNRDAVTTADFEDAKEKVMLGPERRSRVFTDKQKREIAIHEAGHAVIAQKCEHADPVHKVTIIPRGQALGVTWRLPDEDEYTWVEQKYLDTICVALGGRAAEEIFLGRIASGAYDDIRRLTQMARAMVAYLGMSRKLGPISFDDGAEQVFLGRDFARRRTMSERTLETIDDEVATIVHTQLERARAILQEFRDRVEIMADALLERETLNRSEVELIMAGQPLPPPTTAWTPPAPAPAADHAAAMPADNGELPGPPPPPEEPTGGPDS